MPRDDSEQSHASERAEAPVVNGIKFNYFYVGTGVHVRIFQDEEGAKELSTLTDRLNACWDRVFESRYEQLFFRVLLYCLTVIYMWPSSHLPGSGLYMKVIHYFRLIPC